MKYNPSYSVPLVLWHRLFKQCVRKRHNKRDARKDEVSFINACFLLGLHNEYLSDQKNDGGIPRGSEAAAPYSPPFKASKNNLRLFKIVLVSLCYFFHLKGDIGWTAGNGTEPKGREHGEDVS